MLRYASNTRTLVMSLCEGHSVHYFLTFNVFFSFVTTNIQRKAPLQKSGTHQQFNPVWFRRHAYSSIYFFQRLTLYEKLEEHTGQYYLFQGLRSTIFNIFI